MDLAGSRHQDEGLTLVPGSSLGPAWAHSGGLSPVRH